jgi:hypothetical protein
MNNIAKAHNLYELLDQMQVRTAMYVGELSITALYNFIQGYFAALDINGSDEHLIPDFENFHDYVAKYYSYKESTAGWKNIILKENSGNEEKALEVFFYLLKQFRQGFVLKDTLLK